MAFFLEVGDVPIHARNVSCNESLGAMAGRLVTDPQPPTDKPHDTQGKELKLTPPHRQEALQVNQIDRSEDISFWQVSTRALAFTFGPQYRWEQRPVTALAPRFLGVDYSP